MSFNLTNLSWIPCYRLSFPLFLFCLPRPSLSMCFFSVESLYTALKNIDRADIVTSLEGQAPQPAAGSLEEGACRLSDRDSSLLSPSVINGKTTQTPQSNTTSDKQHLDTYPNQCTVRYHATCKEQNILLCRSYLKAKQSPRLVIGHVTILI